MLQIHAGRGDYRTGSVMSELDFLVGRKTFQPIASKAERGGGSGWSHQNTMVLCRGHLCLHCIQHHLHFHGPGLPRHSVARSHHSKSFSGLLVILFVQGFWTQSFGMKLNLHLVQNFFFTQ